MWERLERLKWFTIGLPYEYYVEEIEKLLNDEQLQESIRKKLPEYSEFRYVIENWGGSEKCPSYVIIFEAKKNLEKEINESFVKIKKLKKRLST